MTTDREGLLRFECFADMRLVSACYEEAYGKLVIPNGRDEEPQNLLLNLVIGTFIEAVEDNDRHRSKCLCALQGCRKKPLELDSNCPPSDQFVALHRLLNRKNEFRDGGRQLVCNGRE
jgi:hypothetical protein